MSRRLKVVRRPARPHQSRRQPQERGQAADRDAEGGRFARLEVRGVSRAGAHHLLPALVDGRPGRGRQVLRGADAEPRDAAAVRAGALQGHRLLPGLCRAHGRGGRARTASTPRSWSGRTAGSSASTARSICRAMPSTGRTAPYQHLEKKYFEVGNLGFNVWKMFKDDFIVGQCICNDRRWPETFRVMGLKGAEMVVLGYNTPTDNVYAPQGAAVPARVPPQSLDPGRRLPERHLGRGDGQGGQGRRLRPARRLGDRGADRRDRRQGDDRGGRGHLLRLRPGAGRIHPQHHLQLRQAPPARALQADHRTDRREGRAARTEELSTCNTPSPT